MQNEETNVQLPLQPPLLIADVSGSTSWDEWLSETETKLKELGYRRYVQNHKNEDFCYWKTFKNGEDRIDMCVSKNIDLVEFENMSQTFYGAMSQYYR